MNRLPTIAALVVLAAGCGGSSGSPGTPGTSAAETTTPTCSSFVGQPANASDFETPCKVDEATADLLNEPVGGLFVAGTGTTLCEDGRVLIWNDIGWGYEGEPFVQHVEGAEQVAPQAERDKCATE